MTITCTDPAVLAAARARGIAMLLGRRCDPVTAARMSDRLAQTTSNRGQRRCAA